MKKFQLDLSSKDFDATEHISDRPINKVVICTTPRTAGHALSYRMYQAGWGIPAEYFHSDLATHLYQRWLGETCDPKEIFDEHLATYKQALMAHRVQHQIFSIKIFPIDYFHYKKAFGTENTRYIFLTRADKRAQLISMLTLYLTGRPYDNEHVTKYIPRVNNLNEREVERFFTLLMSQEDYWTKLAQKLPEAQCFHLSSEEFIAAPHRYMSALSDQFNLPFDQESLAIKSEGLGEPYQQDIDIKASITAQFGEYINHLIDRQK